MKIISETRRTFHPLDIPANSRIDRSFDLSVINSVLWQFTCEKLIDIPSHLQQLKLLLSRNTLNLMAICLTILIAFINLYFIYKSSFMNENPFSRISFLLHLHLTEKRCVFIAYNEQLAPTCIFIQLLHLADDAKK